jgi:hypothetical protein
MNLLMRHAGVSVRPMNLLRGLEEVLLRRKTFVKAQMNLLDGKRTSSMLRRPSSSG